ncbi:fungal-specific transcription factor domain-containing protein [Durotheca rogersii]|uniref:fungal-specific transcription factor domain-containing protein n=1 Tax=Durotheca rogersii TaxID=419775 RepID=UPI00221F2FB2|nr:fungal-specific transcription factor domain-containing protein [Durotheca rogersii]KAI5867539.1 fungal-specific transcription factor domain-containing protein [Durotheca rogersii]
MSRSLPELVIPNPSGSCWTCIDEGLAICDRKLPACSRCLAEKRHCAGYHVRLCVLARPKHVYRRPSAPSTVSSLGLPPKEDRLLRHFTNNIARVIIAVDYDGNGYRRLAAIALADDALLNALLALSASHLNRSQKRTDNTPRLYLRQALQHLQTRLQKPAQSRSELTITTMWILLLFELWEDGREWKRHYDGILAWIRGRDADGSMDGFLTSAVAASALQVLLHSSGATREQSFRFLDSVAMQCQEGTIDVIIGCSLDTHKLIMEAAHLHEKMRLAKVTREEKLLQRAYHESVELQSRIRTAHTPLVTRFSLLAYSRSQSALSPADRLEEASVHEAARAAADIFRLALQVYVYRIAHEPTTDCPTEIQDVINSAFERLALVPDTVGPGVFLGWALVVLGSEIDALDRREHIKRRLQSLTLLALNQGLLGLRVLKEVWRRRDARVTGRGIKKCRWQEVMEDLGIDLALV